MYSILIPTFNNLNCLKLCIKSIKKNSNYNHQIIPHVNVGDDGTENFLKQEKIDYTFTDYNAGICEGLNKASKLSIFDYFLYAHDDFYFCPNWDIILDNEVKKIGHNKFYLSGTMMNSGPIKFDCGQTPHDFDEKKFLKKYDDHNYYDFQGSTWAPHLVHREVWEKVNGFSEEFFPGVGSDPDFNLKLWNTGVRIFKGINKFKVYHFGSIVLKKKLKELKADNRHGSRGAKLFLLKWGISIKFFKKFYLKSDIRYKGPLSEPIKDINYFLNLLACKINYMYLKCFF
ncbi:glycosyltransferase [Pelagibacterales bacterium SAG-MED12]|nr:glycosyltransferase [Pelagibacterales bacterium SAG-MED12]